MDRYNSSYRPAPEYDSRRAHNRNEYEDRRPPRYDDRPPPPPPDGDMYRFRGAASRSVDNHHGNSYRPGGQDQSGDSYRPGGSDRRGNDRAHEFNFQSGNAPSFAPTTDYPAARRGPRPQQSGRGGRDRGRSQNTRGGRGGRGRGRGGWAPKRAGERELLCTEREPTPEQMQGMNDGHSRFKDLDDASDSESAAMDLSSESGDEVAERRSRAGAVAAMGDSDSDDEHPRAKRARIHSPAPEQDQPKPKWSNPDPYTALPPPDETQTRKNKDVVKLIRKAKVEAVKPDAGANAASDFISLNFDDDDNNSDDDRSASESGELSPSAGSRDGNLNHGQHDQASRSSFSHLDNLHPDRLVAPPAPDAAAEKGLNMALPVGRLDVWPPPAPGTTATAHDAYGLAIEKQDLADTTTRARQKTGKKRKHPARDLGDIVEDWLPEQDVDPTPWLNLDGGKPPSLHGEILDFYNYVRPREYEEQVRGELVQRIQQAMQQRFPQFQIKAFGSFASGLYLPTADMDLVALSHEFLRTGFARISNNQMHKVAKCLQDARIVKPGSLTVIAHARIPIIKLVDNLTGLRVDISFENNSGVIAQTTFEDWKQRYPAMPIIVSLVKQFLVMRDMSEVFSGGLGGFSVVCLVVSMIRHLQQKKGSEWDQMAHLDAILMEFLIHYGDEFDRFKTGIQMEPWGYISKAQYNPRGAKRPQPERLLIIDPNKYENDISGGSKNVDIIFDAFRDAYDMVNRGFDDADEVYSKEGEVISILDRVWGGNYGMFEEQRARLRHLANGTTRPAAFKPVSGGTQTPINHIEAKRPNTQAATTSKRQKIASGNAGTQDLPIALDDLSDNQPRYATRSRSNAVGKNGSEAIPSINKPDAHKGSKPKVEVPDVPLDAKAAARIVTRKEKKKEKKLRKKEKGKNKDEEATKRKSGDASRARAFKSAHPGVAVPKRLSKEQFKEYTKKHGAGNKPT